MPSPGGGCLTKRLNWERDGADWPNRATSRFVEAGGLTWHVQIMGAGPPLLLLHGTGASTHSWRDLAPLLAGQFTVIAPDLPGKGFTSAPGRGGMGLAGMASGLAALLAALDVKPAVLVGHSAGAALALQLVFDGVVEPRLVVGLNGALRPYGGDTPGLMKALAKVIYLNPLAAPIMARVARGPDAVDRLIRNTGSRLDRRGLELYAQLFRNSGHVAATMRMMAEWDLNSLVDRLPELDVPLTLIVGQEDYAVPPGVAREVAERVAKAEVVAMPGLGHLSHEEAPEKTAEAILDAARAAGVLSDPAAG